MTPLSAHFTLEELTASSSAVRLKLDNTPTPEVVQALTRAAQFMEDVRQALGNKPVRITSGYRSPAVNRAIGGVSTSAHCFGHAIDFQCPSFGTPYEVCQRILQAGLPFDQLIHEYGNWTHISFDPTMRHMPLTIASARTGYLKGILPITVRSA
jgi:hypothetical protein